MLLEPTGAVSTTSIFSKVVFLISVRCNCEVSGSAILGLGRVGWDTPCFTLFCAFAMRGKKQHKRVQVLFNKQMDVTLSLNQSSSSWRENTRTPAYFFPRHQHFQLAVLALQSLLCPLLGMLRSLRAIPCHLRHAAGAWALARKLTHC